MKLKEIKKICGDFTQARKPDGKLTCLHKLADDLCTLPDHFLCEVVSKKRTPEKYISISRIKLWEECQRHWAFRYFWKIDPPMTPKWKPLGRAFAMCRAKIDQGQPWEIPDDVTDDLDRIRLRAVLRGYSKLPRMAETNEDQLSRLMPGIPGLYLLGYLDGLSDTQKTIYEWKYAAGPEGYNTLSMQIQGGGYFHLVPKAESLMICVARKPSRTKPRKGETIMDFEQRLNDDIEARPNYYFTFKKFLRSEFDIPNILDQLETRYRETEIAIKSPVASTFWPNYSACSNWSGCDFASFCKTHTGSGIGCKSKDCSHPDICGAINRVSF